jgi:hypothetical protein
MVGQGSSGTGLLASRIGLMEPKQNGEITRAAVEISRPPRLLDKGCPDMPLVSYIAGKNTRPLFHWTPRARPSRNLCTMFLG